MEKLVFLVVLCLTSLSLAQGRRPNTEGGNMIPGWDPVDPVMPPGTVPGDEWGGSQRTCPTYGIFQAPDPTSCSRFILCNNGDSRPHNCSEGTHFNIERGICIDRDIANCDLCRFNRQPVRFMPLEGSCTRYVVCFGTNRVERECVNGFYFNPRTNQCDRRENVECTEENQDIPAVQCPASSQVQFLPSRQSCEGYFICASGLPTYQTCGDGLIFDINTSRCAVTGRCLLDYKPVCPDTNVRFLPHPFDCRHFFFCNTGEPQLQSCAPGLLFDIASEQCNIDTHATCATPPRDDIEIWPSIPRH